MARVTDLDPKSPCAEAYRTVRTNLSFADIDNNLKTILFTSTMKNEGKSTTVSHISHTFSKLENMKILLVDLDLRNPSIHKMFGVINTYGIMDHLKNGRPFEKCIHKIEDNFHVLTPGSIPPNPTETLSSKKIEEFFKKVREEYDYVFIDAPPVGVVSDATIISKNVDGVMYVVGANETDLSHAQVAIDNLKKADANIIGAVLNKYEMQGNSYGYYGYYYQQDEEQKRKSPRKKKKRGFFKLGFSR